MDELTALYRKSICSVAKSTLICSQDMPLNLKTARQTSLDHGIPYDAVLEAIRKNEIRTVRLNRRRLIPEGAVDEFLNARTNEPTTKEEQQTLQALAMLGVRP